MKLYQLLNELHAAIDQDCVNMTDEVYIRHVDVGVHAKLGAVVALLGKNCIALVEKTEDEYIERYNNAVAHDVPEIFSLERK